MSPARVSLADRSPLELGTRIAKAGEGSVYEVVGRPISVVKIFHPTLGDLAEKLDKVAAMAKTTPPGAVQSDGFAVLTWPQQLVFDDGRPVGYLMSRADTATAVEIHSLSNPSNRANPLPGAPRWTADVDWAHLVNTAANLCLAVQVVHRVDAVIGDFQERNILVSDTSRVTLVDCDSMQFIEENGRQYFCGVARPEFTAPEVAGLNLRTDLREQSSDYFALAVHIHLLLMGGNHPFLRGSWTGASEQPSALELAKSGDWAGGRRSRLEAHPLAPPPTFLPIEMQALFERAFADGATEPQRRPSAKEWREALLRIAFTQCTGGAHHQIPAGCSRCPWCDIDKERRKRRRAADKIPDQVVYRLAKAVGTHSHPPQPSKNVVTPADATGGSAASAARIARAQRLAGKVGGGTATLPFSRPVPPKQDAGKSASPADHVTAAHKFAFVGVSIFFLVAVVCAILAFGLKPVGIKASPVTVDTAPVSEKQHAMPTFYPIESGAALIGVYSLVDHADAANRVAAQLRNGGWTVTEVRSLPGLQATTNTVYFSDSASEQETAESIGRALQAPVAPRGPDLAGLAPGVLIVAVQ